MPLRKYQKVTIDSKHRHEVQVHSQQEGYVRVDVDSNRLLFDALLEELNPEVLEKLDSLWYTGQLDFHLNHNGQAAFPDNYPWLNAATAQRAVSDIRQALQESIGPLPYPVRIAFLEQLAQDLTAPATRALHMIADEYRIATALDGAQDSCRVALADALNHENIEPTSDLEQLAQQFNTPENYDWTDPLLVTQTAQTLRQIYEHASKSLGQAAASIVSYPPQHVANTVFANVTEELSHRLENIQTPFSILEQDGELLKGSHTDQVAKLWSQSIRSETMEDLAKATESANQLAANLTDHPDPLKLIKQAMVQAQNMSISLHHKDESKHLQAAFGQYAQQLSSENSNQAAREIADVLMSDRVTHLTNQMNNLTSISSYRKAHPSVSALHHEMIDNLKANAGKAVKTLADYIYVHLQEGSYNAATLQQYQGELHNVTEEFRRTMLDRHTQPVFHDCQLKTKHQELNERLTSEIIRLLQEHIGEQHHERAPTFSELLSDQRHHETLEELFRPYPKGDRFAVIRYMMDEQVQA